MFQSGLIWNFIDKVSCVWHVTSHLPLLILPSAHLGPRAGLVFMAFWKESPIQYVWLHKAGYGPMWAAFQKTQKLVFLELLHFGALLAFFFSIICNGYFNLFLGNTYFLLAISWLSTITTQSSYNHNHNHNLILMQSYTCFCCSLIQGYSVSFGIQAEVILYPFICSFFLVHF